MKKIGSIVVVGALLLVVSVPVWGQKSGVIGTVHDINGQGCVSCHAPHNGSAATGGTDQGAGKTLLWDRNFSSTTFGTYDSPTLNNKATEVGGAVQPLATDARLYSVLCMSCHDGLTTPTVIGPSSTRAVGNPTTSFGLQNDHPINMTYDQTLDPGLQPLATVTTAGLKLYGNNNTMQCASCHDVHNNVNTHFMRTSNVGSGLCLTCHR